MADFDKLVYTTSIEDGVGMMKRTLAQFGMEFADIACQKADGSKTDDDITDELLAGCGTLARSIVNATVKSIDATIEIRCKKCRDRIAELEKANTDLTNTVVMLTELKEEEPKEEEPDELHVAILASCASPT
jgi:hypothetical protein